MATRTLTALLAAALLAGCGGRQPGGIERVRRSGELRWGADIQGGEPFAFEDPAAAGRLVGFEVEIADAVARELGVRARFVQNDWSTLVPSLERGSYDVALNGLEVTPALAARIQFSRPYFVFAERVMARSGDARIRDPGFLRGLRVGTLSSSEAWGRIQAAGGTPVPYEGVEEPFIDLLAGRTDAVMLDDIICKRYGEPKAGLRVVGDAALGTYALGLRRGDESLRDAIDTVLGRMIASGELRRILGKWGIDSDRQARLTTVAPAPAHGAVAATVGTHPLDARQLALFLQGALVTLLVSCGAMALAVPLGMALAVARLHAPRPVRTAATAYVEIVRGTPVLLQLYVLYYGLAGVLPLDAMSAAILGLGLNYAAYEAEVYRGGIQAVPRGQMEAALVLGMPTRMALRRVVLPQAFRFALPGVTNDFVALLKDSSLVSVISVVELTKRMSIFAVDRREWLVPGALCAGLYFAMSWPLARLAARLERKLGPS